MYRTASDQPSNRRSPGMGGFVLAALISSVLSQADAARASDVFHVRVIDQETERGVPLVELKTVNNVSYWSDSAGSIAIREPALQGLTVYFRVASHGYEASADGFGYRGVRLVVEAGQSAVVRVRRLNRAERLYRVTGGDIYRDTILAGQESPIKEPLVNAKVYGSDSVVNAVYRNQIYWFWGDTNRPKYPLGNFHVPGAVSQLPNDGGLDPSTGVDLTYFKAADGFAKPTCKMPGPGPTWINGLVVLKHGDRERMFAMYVKVKPPLSIYERGIVEFDDSLQAFRKVKTLDASDHAWPSGHPLKTKIGGQEYVYFNSPLALLRVRATAEALVDSSQYESYTYLASGSRKDDYQVERQDNGELKWSWKRDTIPPNANLERTLIRESLLKPTERTFQLSEFESGRKVNVHGASIAWNEFRSRWTIIALEAGGESSLLGEVYYAEAPAPEGPWSPAIKVVTHDRYSFYNPKQHPMLAQQDGRFIYFEGTYTKMFSGNPTSTPHYDYNQVMYRLDLAKPWVKKLGGAAPKP